MVQHDLVSVDWAVKLQLKPTKHFEIDCQVFNIVSECDYLFRCMLLAQTMLMLKSKNFAVLLFLCSALTLSVLRKK